MVDTGGCVAAWLRSPVPLFVTQWWYFGVFGWWTTTLVWHWLFKESTLKRDGVTVPRQRVCVSCMCVLTSHKLHVCVSQGVSPCAQFLGSSAALFCSTTEQLAAKPSDFCFDFVIVLFSVNLCVRVRFILMTCELWIYDLYAWTLLWGYCCCYRNYCTSSNNVIDVYSVTVPSQ